MVFTFNEREIHGFWGVFNTSKVTANRLMKIYAFFMKNTHSIAMSELMAIL